VSNKHPGKMLNLALGHPPSSEQYLRMYRHSTDTIFQQTKYMSEGDECSESTGKRNIVMGMLPVLRSKKTKHFEAYSKGYRWDG
jgi:hypothetical protein